MATEPKRKDPTEAALSAIEEALSLDATSGRQARREEEGEPRLPDVAESRPLSEAPRRPLEGEGIVLPAAEPVAEGLARQMGQVEEASIGGGAHADSIPERRGSCQPGPTEAFPARPEPGRAEDFHRYGEEPVNDVQKRRAVRVSMLAGGV